MDDELEKQLERIETTVAEILAAVKELCDAQTAASSSKSEINERLRRFLERKQ